VGSQQSGSGLSSQRVCSAVEAVDASYASTNAADFNLSYSACCLPLVSVLSPQSSAVSEQGTLRKNIGI